ncbi:MAG TPA: PqqD family peptide modification chaperone [Acetobacteraceae bacterium]|nr:PqqD family peptide modification chaperone [Acetobacteraceae bacterium]
MPELSTCIVFTPAEPRLFNLNPHAWLILELAPGRTREELAENYIARTVPPLTEPVAQRHLQEGLEMLTRCGILESALTGTEVSA